MPLTYHRPSTEGLSSLGQDKDALGYIIFGSASNVEDRLEWHHQLAMFCLERLKEGKKVLGLCFGHQLMADTFGCAVEKNPQEKSHYGTREITFSQDWGSFKKGTKIDLFVAHSYQVTHTNDVLINLAHSEDCPQDALIHKNLPYLGFQAHPEASQDFVTHEVLENNHNLGDRPQEAASYKQALAHGFEILRYFCEDF